MRALNRVIYQGTPKFWGFEEIEGQYDVIKGDQRKKFRFSDPMLRFELMLDGYSPDFRIEKRFQETSRLEVFQLNLGVDNAPRGSARAP